VVKGKQRDFSTLRRTLANPRSLKNSAFQAVLIFHGYENEAKKKENCRNYYKHKSCGCGESERVRQVISCPSEEQRQAALLGCGSVKSIHMQISIFIFINPSFIVSIFKGVLGSRHGSPSHHLSFTLSTALWNKFIVK
ncbi:Hypothetical predicted protein, partial [Podarcis lilfordi]